MSGLLQRLADGADSTIHHVRGCDDVCARIRVGQRLFDQGIYRDVIEYIALVVKDAVLTVNGEGVEGNISHDPKIRHGFLDGSNRALSEAVGIE